MSNHLKGYGKVSEGNQDNAGNGNAECRRWNKEDVYGQELIIRSLVLDPLLSLDAVPLLDELLRSPLLRPLERDTDLTSVM
jgi:hypothetical protein